MLWNEAAFYGMRQKVWNELVRNVAYWHLMRLNGLEEG
jgi:hypothetical protein